MLWNQVAVDRGASTLPIQMRFFILLSFRLFFWCWPASSCTRAAKDAALGFTSGNEQLVQGIPKAIVKDSQAKEKMRDVVLLLAQTGIIFAAVGSYSLPCHIIGAGEKESLPGRKHSWRVLVGTLNWRVPFPNHSRCEISLFLLFKVSMWFLLQTFDQSM